MRIGNLDGRLVILTGAGALDVERASGGRFGADPQAVYDRWAEFRSWAAGQGGEAAEPYDETRLGAPAPAPRQSFGDVIFTGTPAGVGLGRDPQRWLAPGDELVSYVEGIGELRQRFVALTASTKE